MEKLPFIFLSVLVSTHAVLGQTEDTITRFEVLINKSVAESNGYQHAVDASAYRPYNNRIYNVEDADFVIIGAGAAGAALARRLSEISRWKILVLEAGTFGNDFTEIPAMCLYAQESSYNWGFKSVPQSNACLGMVNQKCLLPRGKAFGGTTAINGLRYVRGNAEDFNQWEAEGNPGWSYDYVLPYFRKSENTSIENLNAEYHGYKGPINAQYYKPFTTKLQAAIKGNNEIGIETVDYNGKTQIGVSRSQLNELNGRRISADKGYLQPVKDRANLKLLGNSYVIKIIIDKNSKKAKGVLFSNNKIVYRVKARREIILSAGTINTPHILMHSGIGPADHLKEKGIEVIQDLPVGKNFIDHPMYSGMYFNTNLNGSNQTMREYIKEYLNGYGMYTVATATEGVGYHRSSYNNISSPDIELYYLPANPSVSKYQKSSGNSDEAFNAYYKNFDSFSNIQMRVLCLHPKSRGTIKLASNDPFDYPLVDMNFLSDEANHDANVILDGIKLAIKIFSTNAGKAINATVGNIDIPACKQYKFLSDDYWRCMIKQYTFNGHHLIGTSRMGPDPKSAVVDSNLRVHGIQKLRVADASVINTISGHTSAPSSMVGEKISDVIKLQNGIRLSELDQQVFTSNKLYAFLKSMDGKLKAEYEESERSKGRRHKLRKHNV